MIAARFLHRSDTFLRVGAELVAPTALCERAGGWPKHEASEFANFPFEYTDGQHSHVYFSILGSPADEHIYQFWTRRFCYVVEPLGPTYRDPESLRSEEGGSLRCERARIAEAYVQTYTYSPLAPNGHRKRLIRIG